MTVPSAAPRIDDAAPFAAFAEGLAERALMLQRCRTCGTVQLGRIRCSTCLENVFDWVRSNARGHIHTFAIIHRAYHPAFADRIPYAVGTVELEEGPRIAAAFDIELARLAIDLPVRVAWHRPVDATGLVFIERNA